MLDSIHGRSCFRDVQNWCIIANWDFRDDIISFVWYSGAAVLKSNSTVELLVIDLWTFLPVCPVQNETYTFAAQWHAEKSLFLWTSVRCWCEPHCASSYQSHYTCLSIIFLSFLFFKGIFNLKRLILIKCHSQRKITEW